MVNTLPFIALATTLWTLAILLILHHYLIHPELQGLNRLLQISDVKPKSHEFIVFGLIWMSLGVLLGAFLAQV